MRGWVSAGLDKKEDIVLTVEEAQQHEQIALLPAKASAADKVMVINCSLTSAEGALHPEMHRLSNRKARVY